MSGESRRKIRETIQEVGKAGAYEIHQGKVLSVDETNATMTVEVLELTYYDVRLRAVVTDDTGLWVVPKVGSYVIIGQIEGGVEYVMLQPSEIDKTFLKLGDKTFVMNTEGQVFNGGNNNGLLKLNETVQKLNALEDDVNNLKSLLATVLNPSPVPIPSPGLGAPDALQAALWATLTAWLNSPITRTMSSDIENPNVKH